MYIYIYIPLSLYISLTSDQGSHTLFSCQREREREMSRIAIFILKGMTGASAPFSYLVYYKICPNQCLIV